MEQPTTHLLAMHDTHEIMDDPLNSRTMSEQIWANYFYFLRDRGYQLCPRYNPEWVPSWVVDPTKFIGHMEDRHPTLHAFAVLDARRISDNTKVILKKVETRTNEITVMQHISQPNFLSDPHNHSIPLLDVIPVPDNDEFAFVVIPILMPLCLFPFRHVGEVAEALEQLFEAVAFLHEKDIIHGDVCYFNYLLDASKMIPGGWHFGALYTDDDGNTQYYLADYGLSRRVIDEKDKWIGGIWGQDRSVPEMTGLKMCDGFKVDIYQMGGIVRKLTEKYTGLEAFRPLAKKLMAKDPNMRPSAASAVHLLRYQLKLMSQWQLSAWVWRTGLRKLSWTQRLGVRYFGQITIV